MRNTKHQGFRQRLLALAVGDVVLLPAKYSEKVKMQAAMFALAREHGRKFASSYDFELGQLAVRREA